MNLPEPVSVDPRMCHGQPCMRGTRIPVSVIPDNLAAGLSEEEVRAEYPTLPAGAIRTAIVYAVLVA